MSEEYEEQIQEEVVEVKETPSKQIPVAVITYRDKTVLVQYMGDQGPCRVYIPKKLVGETVDQKILDQGMPYGLPWEEVEFPVITGAELAKELHRHNIWTAEEYRSNPHGVRAAINQLYGKPLALLNTFVKNQASKK